MIADAPTPEEMIERYRRAEAFELAWRSNEKMTFNTTVQPNWLGEGDCFWYIRELNKNNSEPTIHLKE